eukprot:TRINITY_DN1598_c0_g1_i3.p2 TRINITY_DN1598_c0_g1~~TRINITY_DN1598_c0_g1_i3.p2  ORF type:complete len:117 (-),score=29.45 TRINITY_DN1598_c0_g1_i3:816-1166(-)
MLGCETTIQSDTYGHRDLELGLLPAVHGLGQPLRPRRRHWLSGRVVLFGDGVGDYILLADGGGVSVFLLQHCTLPRLRRHQQQQQLTPQPHNHTTTHNNNHTTTTTITNPYTSMII